LEAGRGGTERLARIAGEAIRDGEPVGDLGQADLDPRVGEVVRLPGEDEHHAPRRAARVPDPRADLLVTAPGRDLAARRDEGDMELSFPGQWQGLAVGVDPRPDEREVEAESIILAAEAEHGSSPAANAPGGLEGRIIDDLPGVPGARRGGRLHGVGLSSPTAGERVPRGGRGGYG